MDMLIVNLETKRGSLVDDGDYARRCATTINKQADCSEDFVNTSIDE